MLHEFKHLFSGCNNDRHDDDFFSEVDKLAKEHSFLFEDTHSKVARSLLKNCFQDGLLSQVPLEIWRNIIWKCDSNCMRKISQTCWGLNEVAGSVKSLRFEIAKKHRREGEIEIALKHLQNSAECGNTVAAFNIGIAFWKGGWGLMHSDELAAVWFRKVAEAGCGPAMSWYSCCLKFGTGVKKDVELCNSWGRKALESNNLLAIGYCYFHGLGVSGNFKKAYECFAVSAADGDEFSQQMLGEFFKLGYYVKIDLEKAAYWSLKSAEQGFAIAQHSFYHIDLKESDVIWLKKAADQQHAASKAKMRIRAKKKHAYKRYD